MPHTAHHETPIDPHAVPHGHHVSLDTGLDFINTLELEKGSWQDHLATPEAALEWLIGHNLLHPDARRAELARVASDAAYGEKMLAKVRRVRGAMRELVDASVDRRPPARGELAEVNRALRTHYVTVLVPAPDGATMGHRHEGARGGVRPDHLSPTLMSVVLARSARIGATGAGPALHPTFRDVLPVVLASRSSAPPAARRRRPGSPGSRPRDSSTDIRADTSDAGNPGRR